MQKSKKSIAKKIANAVLTVILVVATVIVGLTFYSKATGKDVLPYKVMWVMTDSMEPTIPARSYVLVRKTTADEIEKNDVITFVSSDPLIKGELNTHRVVDISDDHKTFWTKGDHNSRADDYPVNAEDIKWKYVANLNVLTAFGRFYSTKAGLLVTFAVIIVVVGVAFYFIMRKSKQEQIDELVKQEVARLEKENEKNQSENDENKEKERE